MRRPHPGEQNIGGCPAMYLLDHPCDGLSHKEIWDRPGYFEFNFLDDAARREIDQALSDLDILRVAE